MDFLDRDVKNMPSISYAEYFEGGQSYKCEACGASVKRKEDFLLGNNEASERRQISDLRQLYLLCKCSEGLWLPLKQDRLHNPSHPQYGSGNKVIFAKCEKKEEDFFLRFHIKANIDPDRKMGDKLECLAKDYYKLCCDTIELKLKLRLLNAFLTDRLAHFWVSGRSGLKNSTYDLVQYSSPIFWQDYVSTYFDSCIVRIYRLMDKSWPKKTNSFHTYRKRYLEHYREQECKSQIGEINEQLRNIRNWYVAHNKRQFDPEQFKKPLAILRDSYTNDVLKPINILNKMQGLKIVFCYDPTGDPHIAMPILKIIDNELERYKNADWVGRWSVDGVGLEGSFGVSSTYEFCSNGTFESKDATKVEGEGSSPSETIISRGSYTLTGDSYSMKVENTERTSFVRRSGTWVRDGDTLTLTDDDDGVIVLKKD